MRASLDLKLFGIGHDISLHQVKLDRGGLLRVLEVSNHRFIFSFSDNDRNSPVDKGSLQRIRTAWATSGGDKEKSETDEDADSDNK